MTIINIHYAYFPKILSNLSWVISRKRLGKRVKGTREKGLWAGCGWRAMWRIHSAVSQQVRAHRAIPSRTESVLPHLAASEDS